MRIHFSKYHGTGNDFIIIDNRQIDWEPTVAQVSFLCDRHLGIGADGLMLLSEKSGYDFAMSYYNSDGHESTMCGNGGRCMAAYAKSLGLAGKNTRFWAVDGMHEAKMTSEHSAETYKIKMKDTQIGKIFDDGLFIDTGSPHFVTFVKDTEAIDVFGQGKALRNDLRFAPGGTNVDFVEVLETGLFVRSYERGVENETLSCGTGVTASAIAAAFRYHASPGLYNIQTLGGMLRVHFTRTGEQFTNIWLEGPARFVFSGEISLGNEVAK